MAKYSNTKAKINEKITTNGAQAITGGILNDVLQTMVDSLGADYQSGGLIQPDSSFIAGEQPVVFLATTTGTYTNFGGLVVADGEVALLVWSGSAWSKQTPDIATRTEVSQLGQEIDKKYTKPSTGIPASDMATGVIPDVSQFITRSVSDLANYYLKTETYTKDEVADLIGAIQQFHYEVYASLPATGESNVLYLIGPTGTGSDRYEEYVYSNGTFMKIGDTSIDLSGYVTTQALNAALADYTTTANLSQLLSQKENIANKVTSISEQSTDGQYPSAKLLYDMLFEKLVVPVTVISGGTIEDVIGADITVFDNDHNVTIATKEFQGEPLVFRIKAGINYTLSGESIEPFDTPVSVEFKSELDSIRNYTIQYFDSPIINFADPNVAAICINNWGNGEIITEKMARDVTTLSNKFQDNTVIEAFDELRYFTGLTNINVEAFSGATNLESVILPNTITAIYHDAFINCSSLSDCQIPVSVTNIEYRAFQATSALTLDVNLPNLTTLGPCSFFSSGITKITSLGSITIIPGGNYNVGLHGVFESCTSLTEVTLPQTLETIGYSAFRGCTALTSINLPTSITTIGDYAFENTKIDNEVNLPNLTSIAYNAFRNSGITKVLNLGSITTIPIGGYGTVGAFNNCTSLTEVVLPNTLTVIANASFQNCTALTTINLPTGITSIGDNAFANTKITNELNLPNLTGIGTTAFLSTKITKILDLGSVTVLAGSGYNYNGIFASCTSLTEATLPSTLTTLGRLTFGNCTALTTIVCLATVPPSLTVGSHAGTFWNTPNLTHIYVPYGCGETYKTATNWIDYASIIYELDENGNIPV